MIRQRSETSFGVLLIGFGGPTRPEEIRPFLANVLRGRPVPEARVEEVVRHYQAVGGRSPYNDQTFRQAAALREVLARNDGGIPVYVGMRNWSPHLSEVLARIRDDGIRRLAGFILAPHRCEASWERYCEAVEQARAQVGDTVPVVDYVDSWYDHHLFIEAVRARVEAALERFTSEERKALRVIFTAHSIPARMAGAERYAREFAESARLVASAGLLRNYSLAYQSRSGDPREPWLEPDIATAIAQTAEPNILVVPLGFLCDHVEVIYDLDIEMAALARSRGKKMIRAATVGDEPRFIEMMADVIRRRMRSSVGLEDT